MIKLALSLLQIQSIRRLKLVFSIGYINFLVVVAYIHLLRYSESFTQTVNATSLSQDDLNEISDLRGLRKENESKNRKELEDLIQSSGNIYNSEITNAHLAHDYIEQKIFNSAGELLESIEDSRDSVWLIHIVMNNDNTDNSHLKFVRKKTWKQLAKLSKFNILTGTFDCAKDPFFCQIKGWSKPQLVLSIVNYNHYTQSNMVKLYNLSDYAYNSFENVTKWLKDTLKKRLISSEITAPITAMMSKITQLNNNDELKIFYKKILNVSSHIPFFYTAMSIKYNHRAKFYYLENTEVISNNVNCKYGALNRKNSNTPIYLVIDNQICYNYGTNLNELPNYTNMNMFLMFLHPDLNSIFLISFYLLNSFLVMIFFEYNKSFMRMLARGVVYLCICNFILFSIWLVQNASSNSTDITVFSSISARFFVWYRYVIMSNSLCQQMIAHVRFVLFYHLYIQSSTAFLSYMAFLILYYMETKRIYNDNEYEKLKNDNEMNLKSNLNQQDRINEYENLANDPQMNIRSSSHLENNTNRVTNVNQSLAVDSDMEISIHELISQINGPTSIWLQSSTHADRLILELPHFEYCKCFYAHTVKFHDCDETDIEDLTDRGETEDDEKSKVCECGRNKELNKYLDQNCDLNVKFRRECSVCLDKYTYCSIMVMLPCGHSFHRQCIYEWFMNSVNYKLSCPMCRTSFYNNKKII